MIIKFLKNANGATFGDVGAECGAVRRAGMAGGAKIATEGGPLTSAAVAEASAPPRAAHHLSAHSSGGGDWAGLARAAEAQCARRAARLTFGGLSIDGYATPSTRGLLPRPHAHHNVCILVGGALHNDTLGAILTAV